MRRQRRLADHSPACPPGHANARHTARRLLRLLTVCLGLFASLGWHGAAAAPAGPGVVLLGDCAPPGALQSWQQRLREWGYAVESTGERRCHGALADLSLGAARDARQRLAARQSVDAQRIALLGWDAPLVVHAAGSVAQGRPEFAAALLGVARPAQLLSSVDLLDGIDQRPDAEVRAFLGRTLAARHGDVRPQPQALIETGPDLPPHGRSLFDRLFPSGPPFPFEALLDALAAAIGQPPSSASGPLPAGIAATLIPTGRSLQRHASDQPLRFPRAVIAIDGDAGAAPQPQLRDRLFIGYQPSTAQLEVISWNPQSVRFEFQLVDDYRAGGEPRVRYAHRRLCLACHQNLGPIFSAAPWDESTDNQHVAARLRGFGERFYGLPVGAINNAAVLLDNATDRANRLPLRAALWRELCGAPGAARRRCRAAWLGRMLEYRLSRTSEFATYTEDFVEHFLPRAQRNWNRQWPQGLVVPDPDIANRDPQRDAELFPALDPLRPRMPLEYWHWSQDGAGRAVRELAADLPRDLLQRVDRALAERAKKLPALRAECHSLSDYRRVGWRLRELDCDGDFSLRGQFRWRPDGSGEDGEIAHLGLPGMEPRVRLQAPAAGGHFAPVWRDSPWHLRLAPGRLAAALQVEEGFARLLLRSDALAQQQALENMSRRVGGPLDDPAWQPRALLAELLGALLEPPPKAPAEVEFAAPPQAVERPPIEAPDWARPLVEHCADCHAGNGHDNAALASGGRELPPRLFTADAAQTALRLRACAAQIRARLVQWRAPATARQRTPMPPAVAVGGDFADGAAWRELIATAAQVAPAATSGGYADLPICAPASAAPRS